jgi:hypothetical protein
MPQPTTPPIPLYCDSKSHSICSTPQLFRSSPSQFCSPSLKWNFQFYFSFTLIYLRIFIVLMFYPSYGQTISRSSKPHFLSFSYCSLLHLTPYRWVWQRSVIKRSNTYFCTDFIGDSGGRAVWGLSLRRFNCWDRGLKYSLGHDFSPFASSVCWVSSRLLRGTDRSFIGVLPGAWQSVCVIWKPRPRTDLGCCTTERVNYLLISLQDLWRIIKVPCLQTNMTSLSLVAK